MTENEPQTLAQYKSTTKQVKRRKDTHEHNYLNISGDSTSSVDERHD